MNGKILKDIQTLPFLLSPVEGTPTEFFTSLLN
jgi:hypothetical protein